MLLVQVFLIFIIFLKILFCETATTLNSRLANRKQQKLIEGSMDLSANPCEDFYQYACGKWDNLHMEAGQKYHETVTLLDYYANKEMARTFLRINLHNKPKFVKRAYEYYKSCKDIPKYEPLQYFKWMKENENIEFPTLWTHSNKTVDFDWTRTLAVMRSYGLNGIFIEEIILQRRDNPLKFIIDLDKPVANGGFTALEIDVFKMLIDYYINIPYFKALDELLKNHTPRFLCKYLEFRFLCHLYQQGPRNFIDEDCLSNVRSFLPMAINWLYEQQHPDLQLEFPKITAFFEDIRKHFIKSIQQNDYGFNATVVDFLMAKIKNMQLKLNYIPRIDSIKTLEKFHDSLQLNIGEFYANHLKLLKFNFISSHNLLIDSTQQDEFFYLIYGDLDTGPSSSPYYILRSNIVVVPLTLLQQPIYPYPDSDDIYKYSSLGFLLAHEMIHGFDSTGLEIGHKGQMVPHRYDDIIANPLFNASFNCLLELNPSVIDEKIADVSGLRLSYQIFRDKNPDALTTTRRIYDMDVSLSKLFFLNFAQFFCGTTNSHNFMVMVMDHGSDRERVMDVLTHFPEFSKVFQCNSNNRMYSHESCHLWRR